MEIVYAFLLAAIQAVTEFLPVSSSGHLQVLKEILEVDAFGLSFDIVLHLGTMAATLFVLRRNVIFILQTTLDALKPNATFGYRDRLSENEGLRMLAFMMITTLPLVFLGLGGRERIEALFSSLWIVSLGFFITTLVLIYSARCRGQRKTNAGEILSLSWMFPVVVGLFQMLAVLPGVSRSGMCIVAALMMGASRKMAGEYAFLISLPTIMGATLFMFLESEPFGGEWAVFLTGLAVSFSLGIVALKFLLGFIARGKLHYFAGYTALMGMYSLCLWFF